MVNERLGTPALSGPGNSFRCIWSKLASSHTATPLGGNSCARWRAQFSKMGVAWVWVSLVAVGGAGWGVGGKKALTAS